MTHQQLDETIKEYRHDTLNEMMVEFKAPGYCLELTIEEKQDWLLNERTVR